MSQVEFLAVAINFLFLVFSFCFSNLIFDSRPCMFPLSLIFFDHTSWSWTCIDPFLFLTRSNLYVPFLGQNIPTFLENQRPLGKPTCLHNNRITRPIIIVPLYLALISLHWLAIKRYFEVKPMATSSPLCTFARRLPQSSFLLRFYLRLWLLSSNFPSRVLFVPLRLNADAE